MGCWSKKRPFPSLPVPSSIPDGDEHAVHKDLGRKEFKALSGCFEKPLVLGEFVGGEEGQGEQGIAPGEGLIEPPPQRVGMLPVTSEDLFPKERGTFGDGEFHPRDCSFRSEFTQALKEKTHWAGMVQGEKMGGEFLEHSLGGFSELPGKTGRSRQGRKRPEGSPLAVLRTHLVKGFTVDGEEVVEEPIGSLSPLEEGQVPS